MRGLIAAFLGFALIVSCFARATTAIGPASTAVQDTSADADRVEAVIHGRLEINAGAEDDRDASSRYVVLASGIRFLLAFPEDQPDPSAMSALADSRVIVRGHLKAGPEANAPSLLCIVEGPVKPAPGESVQQAESQPAAQEVQLLVAYEKGEEEAGENVQNLCKLLGLEILGHNQTGGFFKVAPTEKTPEAFEELLEQDPRVRFIEKEQVYRTQPVERPR